MIIKLDRCKESCNTIDNPSGRICVRKKTEDVNLNAFNMITKKNESKPLKKHISCDCRCNFDGRKCNVNQK